MPVARFQMPDGRVARFEVPDGTTPEQAQSMMASHFAQQGAAPEKPAEDHSLIASAGAGLGSEFGNIVLGGQKLVGKGLGKLDGLVNGPSLSSLVTGQPSSMLGRAGNWLVKDAEQGQARLKSENAPYAEANPLTNSAGKFATDMIVTAPIGGLIAKGARAIAPNLAATQLGANLVRAIETSGAQGGNLVTRSAGAAMTGAATAGVINPDDVGNGALIGVATPGAIKLAGKAGGALADLVRPSVNASPLAKKAVDQYGIPLSIADVTDSRAVKAARSFLGDLPVIGRPAQALKDQQTKAFNKAVGSTFGAADESLTPQVMDAAKKRLGGEFDRIWNNNTLQVDGQMFQKLIDMDTLAAKLPRNEGQSLKAELQDLFSKMQQDQSGNLFVPGDVANKFQSYIRRRAESSSGLRNELGDLRQTIIGAFNRSVRPEDAAALTANRAQYKALKTVEPLLNSAEVGVAGRVAGDVPIALLPSAVNRSYSNPAGVPLAELSSIGSRFLVDRTPQTGGSARAMIQNSALGTGLALSGWSNPLLAGGGLLAMGGASKALNSPMLARKLMNQAPQVPTGLLYQGLPLLGAQ